MEVKRYKSQRLTDLILEDLTENKRGKYVTKAVREIFEDYDLYL